MSNPTGATDKRALTASADDLSNSAGKFVDLVLGGGGVKGIGLVGAISVLEESGYSFKRVAGTSAGAIVASLVAAKMPVPVLKELMESLDYTKFQDDTKLDHVPLVGEGLSLWFTHGVYAGEYLHTWIGEKLGDLGVETFNDLFEADPNSSLPVDLQYRLVVMTSDITRGQLLRLPWDYANLGLPAREMRVADAVRASMSMPFFYRPAILTPAKGAPSTLVDGGLLSNFPVDTFDRTDDEPRRWPTFGIKLSSRQPPEMVRYETGDDFAMAKAMFGTLQSWSDQQHLDDPSVTNRTIFVDTFGINATDFGIDKEAQDRLYQSGRKAAAKFLQALP